MDIFAAMPTGWEQTTCSWITLVTILLLVRYGALADAHADPPRKAYELLFLFLMCFAGWVLTLAGMFYLQNLGG